MTTKKAVTAKKHVRRSDAFKQEVLALANEIGVAQAARQLGVYDSQIYQWRAKAAAMVDQSVREDALAVENARLKKELARHREEVAVLKKAAAYFASQSL